MQLSAELFRQMVESLQADRNDDGQRRRPRVGLDARVTIVPFSDRVSPSALSVTVRDLSAGGLGFLHDRKISLGEQFVLLLPEAQGKPVVILCTVAYWQPLARDRFAIGASFTRVLRQGEVPLPLVLEANAEAAQRAAS
jgi:hypothetical protein